MAAAQSAVKTDTNEREGRIRDLRAELTRVEALADRARKLATQAGAITAGTGRA